ncbi:MAG: DUF2933 domain-containing protein [Proteobacteria bacterium]|nr:DUF2933 domain-containing protein [Desulfobulbaceae bacterium]MBU4152975.1 DUF2933 domain-containing protein [Pseudomonadota bacterium]
MTSNNSWADFLKALSGPRLAFLAFIAAGGYFLWTEHQAHLLGALPYLILLLCPLMHLFMHRGHGDHQKDNETHNHDNH